MLAHLRSWLFHRMRFLIAELQVALYATPHIHGPKERLVLGKNVDLGNAYLNTRSGRIIIEDGVMLSHHVMLITGIHDYAGKHGENRAPTIEDAGRDIHIGAGAWITSGVIIIGPVKIGKNSVIGAGSVVVHDVPDQVLAAGNPARVIKRLG